MRPWSSLPSHLLRARMLQHEGIVAEEVRFECVLVHFLIKRVRVSLQQRSVEDAPGSFQLLLRRTQSTVSDNVGGKP